MAVRAVDQAAEELWNIRSELPVALATAIRPPAQPPAAVSLPVLATPAAARPEPSRPAADFMAKPHVEGVVTSLALAARYVRWLRTN
ncbi:hypothetical protein BBK82_10550 [Lentzea guizhouensis]|uniref:Uncharacterized protein n=1 Tax=Lentzea guizhouensis TaxID=1586287 RepID=A0A1B2HFG8_9PSEU|nr:hypothetical protein BBK82_10550 [Lentzea guizhouensis]